jgi:hypothetical protein
MTILAEVSDKIVSPGQIWAVMGVLAAVLGAIAFASRSWGILFLAVPASALGSMLVLSFLDDPFFGDAVLQENGSSWFASGLAASALPVAAVIVALIWSKRLRREAVGFEVVRSGGAAAE